MFVSKLRRWYSLAGIVVVLVPAVSVAQEPVDLFADVPRLSSSFVRIGAWNLRHINVEGQADDFLSGNTEEADFAILIATYAKAIRDLGLDIVACPFGGDVRSRASSDRSSPPRRSGTIEVAPFRDHDLLEGSRGPR